MVKHITQFSPAQTLFFIKEKKATAKEMGKLTLADLLSRKVLHSFDKEVEINGQNEKLKYLTGGEKFQDYQPKDHEKYILEVFQKDPSIEVPFSQIVKVIAYYVYKIKKAALKSVEMMPYLKYGLFGSRLNREGKEMQSIILQERDLLLKDKNYLTANLSVLGASVFLLDGFDWGDFEEEHKKMNKEEDFEYPDFDLDFLRDYDDFGSDFDGGFDAGGCSGDGGGDSGCGSGCGGCGGD